MNIVDKLEQPGTLGFFTGKSERSAIDFFERIETNFLEKYLLYILMDEVGSDFFTATDLDPQMISQTYVCTKTFNNDDFITKLDDFLNKYNKAKKKETNLIKVFQNFPVEFHNNVYEDQLIFFYQKIKMTISKLRDLAQDITKKLKREQEMKNYQSDIINIIAFYTGDVNYDFQNDQALNEETIIINGKQYIQKISIYYISKVSLFNHFARANNLNIEYLDDKIITLFELKRLSLRRRQQAILRAKQETRRKEERKIQMNEEDITNSRSQSVNLTNKLSLSSNQDQIQPDIIHNKQLIMQQGRTQDVNDNELYRQRKRNLSVGYSNTLIGISVFLGLSVGVPLLIKRIMKN